MISSVDECRVLNGRFSKIEGVSHDRCLLNGIVVEMTMSVTWVLIRLKIIIPVAETINRASDRGDNYLTYERDWSPCATTTINKTRKQNISQNKIAITQEDTISALLELW